MENKSYVIKNNVTDRYIGIDNASGGYPYELFTSTEKIDW